MKKFIFPAIICCSQASLQAQVSSHVTRCSDLEVTPVAYQEDGQYTISILYGKKVLAPVQFEKSLK